MQPAYILYLYSVVRSHQQACIARTHPVIQGISAHPSSGHHLQATTTHHRLCALSLPVRLSQSSPSHPTLVIALPDSSQTSRPSSALSCINHNYNHIYNQNHNYDYNYNHNHNYNYNYNNARPQKDPTPWRLKRSMPTLRCRRTNGPPYLSPPSAMLWTLMRQLLAVRRGRRAPCRWTISRQRMRWRGCALVGFSIS